MSTDTNDRRGLWAAGGSVIAAVVASACCWLPLLLIGFGASAAGVSATFERFRPLMLGVTAVLLGAGFYLVYFRKEKCAPGQACSAPNPKLQRLNRAMLWVATVAVVAFAAFPKYAGLFAEDASSLPVDASNAPTVSLDIEGMTCEACASHIQKELVAVPGVVGAAVDYAGAKATVAVESSSPPPMDALVEAVKAAGYTVRPAGEK
jgi:copper chaperone CopZ